jgi:plastocyanin
MRTRRLLPLASLAVAGALSLVACGDDDSDSESPSSAPAAAADVVVTGVDGIKWDAESYSATAGDVTIMLRNQSTLPHTLAVVAADGTKVGAELKTTSNGDEETGTYPLTAGTYTIICTVPGHGAMKADLVVT